MNRKTAGCYSLIAATFLCVLLLRSNERKMIKKKSLPEAGDRRPPTDASGTDLKSGLLICDKIKSPSVVIPEKPLDGRKGFGVGGEAPLVAPVSWRGLNREPLVNGWVDRHRKIGCCPPGDRRGRPYTEGMACCVDQIYNATSEFCCAAKAMTLSNSPENVSFCLRFPPVCRISDLRLEQLRPLNVTCIYTATKERIPTECTFVCPPGSQVRGDKKVVCTEKGRWTEASPQCCEGCPPTFVHDFWFLIDSVGSIGIRNFSALQTFIRRSIAYFPISKSRVRISVTPFNDRLELSTAGWGLGAYNSLQQMYNAINGLSPSGSERNMAEALRWLARNRLQNHLEDRQEVEDLVILITTGPPDDGSLAEIGKTIRNLGRFMVVAVGPEATSMEFREIVSAPTNENYFRVPDFHDLEQIHKSLYSTLCRRHCLQS